MLMATTTETNALSERKCLRQLYEPFMDIAVPGDIAFFITNSSRRSFSWKNRLYRRWLGIAPDDDSAWHTVVYVGTKKSEGEQERPYIVHSTNSNNTIEEHLKPSFFSFKPKPGQLPLRCRTELLHFPELTADQRRIIVDYCRAQVGKPFDGDGWLMDIATYALGIRTRERSTERVSCHGLAFNAYGAAGITFPHPRLPHAPFLLGRLLGHPLGHPADHVDLRYNYLRDHHLYTDPRGVITLALVGHGPKLRNSELKLAPGRYSWDHSLRAAYR